MTSLNVEMPDVITRVSEFVPEIIDFIKKLEENQYAYRSNGSVYFNVAKFNDGTIHKYPKLLPSDQEEKTKEELLQEGEGVLTSEAQEKVNKEDFVLWKKSKENEPTWDSEFGPGRPGWHIECSAMAASVFKDHPIDIHSGGIDLRFPHHCNEIAQSEAFYNCDQWISYFLHTGHLHIDKRKMSKSEKNFITIKEILKEYSPRTLRFSFLLHQWNTLMNYDPQHPFTEAVEKERQFSEFFRSVKAVLRQCNVGQTFQKWEQKEFDLHNLFLEKQF
mmetsp:Transcript_34574/g.33786  ORF Transcript_34574/g.33786 Transcript_34574/m.33786 type:complete len:275 (-) Transcript_34574:195-1019(-)